jgi:prepilin-type processing-associated H-X9-DG protein
LHPYTKSLQILVCPSGNSATAAAPYAHHYGSNIEVTPFNTGGVSLAQIQTVANTFLMMDSGTYGISYNYATNPDGSFWYTPGACGPGGASTGSNPLSGFALSDCQTGRHLNGSNVAYADGHVKWLQWQKFPEEANKPARGAWNPAN